MKTVGDLKALLAEYPDNVPIVVFSSEFDCLDFWHGTAEFLDWENLIHEGNPPQMVLFVGQ